MAEVTESVTSTEGAPARPPWHQSKAPASPKPLSLVIITVTSVTALVLLVVVGTVLDQTVLIPPLAASMALVAGASGTPLAQPRNVIGGQLVSALTGFVVLAVAGPGVWESAVAGGLAVGAMLALRVGHSPAAATAVIVAVTDPPVLSFLVLLALATVILVLVGLAGNRVDKRRYPVYWW